MASPSQGYAVRCRSRSAGPALQGAGQSFGASGKVRGSDRLLPFDPSGHGPRDVGSRTTGHDDGHGHCYKHGVEPEQRGHRIRGTLKEGQPADHSDNPEEGAGKKRHCRCNNSGLASVRLPLAHESMMRPSRGGRRDCLALCRSQAVGAVSPTLVRSCLCFSSGRSWSIAGAAQSGTARHNKKLWKGFLAHICPSWEQQML